MKDLTTSEDIAGMRAALHTILDDKAVMMGIPDGCFSWRSV